jgi:phosphoribosylanthranilate isomerase
MTAIKICGLRTPEALAAAAPADFIGLVFHAESRRNISPTDAAKLVQHARPLQKKVGLFVNPEDAALQEVLTAVPLDMIQLHGDETPARVRDIRKMTGLLVMKAIRVGDLADIRAADDFAHVANWLLFDAKSKKAPGGTGESFDWNMLKNFSCRIPWMLAGGLNAANVGTALSILTPDAVDVSSGVESAPGQKDPALIKDFIATVLALR